MRTLNLETEEKKDKSESVEGEVGDDKK